MDYYFHHIPGRLRVKSPLLKKNPPLAARAEQLLKSLSGVDAIAANPVTGSIVVRYDSRETSSEDILRALNRAGYFDPSQAVTNDELISRAFSKAGKTIGSILFGVLVKDELEGSALAVIAALI
jgi:hypothetical protein